MRMPVSMMRKIFSYIPDRCLVVSILGPQSSGKSTLLNFMFGCDFAMSEGRCTRGIYGSYFKFRDRRVKNYDGIFVIDTEGLFSVSERKTGNAKERENFDSKLVLFCLAISDMVIINVRGNIDNNVEKILRICS